MDQLNLGAHRRATPPCAPESEPWSLSGFGEIREGGMTETHVGPAATGELFGHSVTMIYYTPASLFPDEQLRGKS